VGELARGAQLSATWLRRWAARKAARRALSLAISGSGPLALRRALMLRRALNRFARVRALTYRRFREIARGMSRMLLK
jgi:hypothetical protein